MGGAGEGADFVGCCLVRLVALETWVSLCIEKMLGKRKAYLDEHDVGACFGQGDGHGCADAAGAACHDGGLAGEGEEVVEVGGHLEEGLGK